MSAPAVPELSVVVATRNRPDKALRCARTIAACEGAERAELIVVDQSTVPLADIQGALAAEGFAIPVRHVATPTVGVSRGRNIGAGLARARLMAVTDDDCTVAPDWIRGILARFQEDPALDALCGRILPFGEQPPGTVPVSIRTATRPRLMTPGADPSEWGSGGNFTVRVALLGQLGGYDEAMGPGTAIPAAEDTELIHRVVAAGARIAFSPDPVVYHESWRTPDELLGLIRGYAFGAAVYLTRRVIAEGDLNALGVLARRILRDGLWLMAGAAVLGRPWHFRAAWRRFAGGVAGATAVLTRNRHYGIDRAWLTRFADTAKQG